MIRVQKIVGGIIGFAIVVCAFTAYAVGVVDSLPAVPTGYVSDTGAMLSDAYRTQLEGELSSFDKQTGNQIAVVTIPSLQGDTVENVAVQLFEKWGIGKKDSDNGVLLLIARDDKKVRIEVGYGLEGNLTDGTTGEIIRNDITPAFKEAKYDDGVRAAVNSIERAVLGNAVPFDNQDTGVDDMSSGSFEWLAKLFSGFALVILVILAIVPGVWLGGLIGICVGGVLGFSAGGVIGSIFGAILGCVIGILVDFLAPLILHSGFWGRGGGGGGGGGFGGFGGGRSGGGGASGGW